ncbi:MAG: TetR/AcrR family transcriptional regulator [Actinoplanes sp.]
MDFKRAHTEEQRAVRRRQILDTAAAMLTEMPVAQLSLNGLSRRACLAKSNVLRYFESREAVLLELMDTELASWLAELDGSLQPAEGTVRERGDRIAAVLAESLARRPVLCDLISAQAMVLEHNVSTEAALAHKRSSHQALEVQAQMILRCLPELGRPDAERLCAVTVLVASSAWPYSQPPAAMLAAYAADPALAALRIDFTDLMRQMLEVTISGLLTRADQTTG